MLLGAGLLVAIGLAEVALRIAGIGYPSFYEVERFRGVALRPGAEGWQRREGEAYVRVNAAGLRDRDHVLTKPPDTFRIAFLGDSYTEALNVETHQAYWAVAERALAQCPALAGRSVEAINFGVSGYGTAQALQTLRHKVWDYQPDVVVLGFLTGNDLRNNERELERDPLRPYFVVRDGTLTLDDSFLESPEWARTQAVWWRAKNAVVTRLRTLQLAYESRDAVVRNRLAPKQELAERPIYLPPQDEQWTRAWDVTERLLRLMRDEVVAGGARFELLILTNASQVDPDPAVRARSAAEFGAADLQYPDRRLEAFAKAEGIDVLPLVGPLAAYAESHGVCLHGFPNAVPCGGHWNVEGHRLGGQHLAAALCDRLEREAALAPH